MDEDLMQALVCYGDHKVKFEKVAKPKITDGNETIIKVRGTGICGSDHMLFDGNKNVFFIEYPVIPGHEFAGIVEEIGKDVTKFKVGDHVAVDNYLRCGKCFYCISGDYFQCDNHTELGFTYNGGFAEYCLIPDANLIKIPKEMDFKYAAIIENIATAIRACKKGKLRFGDKVVVIGPGPLGILIALVSKYLGCDVTVVGRSRTRLDRVEKMGFYKVLDSSKDDWVSEILNDTNGKGADAIFEVSGSNEPILGTTRVVRKKGTVVLLGVTGGKVAEIDLDKVVLSEINIVGSISGQGVFSEAIKLVPKIQKDLEKFITHTFKFEDVFTAVKYERERIDGAIKIVVLQ